MRHIQGENRHQTSLLPPSLEDFVATDHPVRVIDALVDKLDLASLGFAKAVPKDTGRKPYDPGDLLKLYVYGYLNQVTTSRRLERECHRNLEVLWLLGRLAPDFKTIADFRKDNGPAIRQACRTFIQFAARQDYSVVIWWRLMAASSRRRRVKIKPSPVSNSTVTGPRLNNG